MEAKWKSGSTTIAVIRATTTTTTTTMMMMMMMMMMMAAIVMTTVQAQQQQQQQPSVGTRFVQPPQRQPQAVHPQIVQPQVVQPQVVQPHPQSSLGGTNARPQFFPAPITSPPQTGPAATVSDSCLQCICQASTECKLVACHLAGPSQYFCGPYLISWAYWADAGKPQDNVNNPYAFEACLNDASCAATTIRNYMAKHGRDCDGNGVIDCRDIARIHKAGPGDCQGKWVDSTPYWATILQCAA